MAVDCRLGTSLEFQALGRSSALALPTRWPPHVGLRARSCKAGQSCAAALRRPSARSFPDLCLLLGPDPAEVESARVDVSPQILDATCSSGTRQARVARLPVAKISRGSLPRSSLSSTGGCSIGTCAFPVKESHRSTLRPQVQSRPRHPSWLPIIRLYAKTYLITLHHYG